ncbi:hypothetical protein [Azohydromonas aeria]|uniref:hypothetical protein n=1 Tax=Azohydromonas aeria TaxID=2590212 RepID=UPI0012FC553B|nr:hypothetical protein [Azohydromonas aeria]
MNAKRILGTLALGLSLLPALSHAATYYVRPGAAGDGSGRDWTNAFPALPAALTRGDTYYLAPGLYAARTFATPASGSATITLRKATASDHGTSSGWNPAWSSGQVVFGGGLSFKSPNWVLDGQTGGGAAEGWKGNFGIKIVERGDRNAVISVGRDGDADNVTIRHVELVGKGSVSSEGGSFSNDGLAVYGAANVTLSHFRMTGIGRCPFFVSARNLVVEHGWVESYFGSGSVHSEVASIWGFSGSVGDVTFRHNLFTDIRSTGGIMWDNQTNPSARLLVYGNVFYRPPGARWDRANGVVGGWTGNGGEQFHNAKVYNNAFINVDQAPLSSLPRVASGNEALNNIFYNGNSPDFSRFARHDYNVFINAGGAQGESQGVVDNGGDPFVDTAGLDFRLKRALGAGAPLPAPFDTDGLGLSRLASGVFERGPFGLLTAAGAPPAAPTGLKVD